MAMVWCVNMEHLHGSKDSTDPRWSSKASMSRRHRFLTTKDGMVVSGVEGVDGSG